MPLTNITSN